MSESGSSGSKKRKLPSDYKNQAIDDPRKLRERRQVVRDDEISDHLMNESDDSCSIFDDSLVDPEFFLESDHQSNSEQSEVEESWYSHIEPEDLEAGNQKDHGEHGTEDHINRDNQEREERAGDQQYGEELNDERQDSEERADVQQDGVIEVRTEHTETIRERYYYGKNRHKWSSQEPARSSRTRQHNILNIQNQSDPKIFSSFEELWALLFTEDMKTMIMTRTNEKLDKYRREFKDTARSELSPLTVIELNALFGLLFYTSVFRSNHENAEYLYATDGTGRDIFRCVMSKNRFLTLINCLRFDDSQTREERQKDDKLAAVSDLFNAFINNSRQNYTLSADVCIDEMLVAFRGRCGFVIYMPSKPNKYGLKILGLVDARTFYIYNAYVYTGRGSDGATLTDAEKKFSIPTQSVIRLTKGIEGSNRNVTADNWFSSIELIQRLKASGLTYLGTLKKNKREIPPEFQASKERVVGSVLYGFTRDYTILSYVPKPKKAVLVVSSMHHKKETDDVTGKPAMIIDYNKNKGGVDEVDKKCSNYSCSRRTRRWPMVLFYRLMDMSGVNAYVLYNKCNNVKKLTRGCFLLSLARELVLPEMKLRVYNDRIPRELRCSIERVIGPKDMPSPPPARAYAQEQLGIRKTCAICPSRLKRRTKYSCCLCNKPMCLTCCLQICNSCKP